MAKSNAKFAEEFYLSAPDYTQTETYSGRDWAWEFLRRNPDYQRAAFASRLKRRRIQIHISDTRLYRHSCQQSSAQKWKLLRFADPRKSAHDVDTFWIPDDVMAKARRFRESQERADFDINTARNLRAILFNRGAEYCLFRTEKTDIQIKNCGTSLLFSPVQLTFQLDGFDDLERKTKGLFDLRSVLKTSATNLHKKHSVRTSDTQKRALIALDCKLKHGSLQDTAHVFQKLHLTQLSWSTSGNEALKKQVWRHRKKGIALMRQTYRSLL